MELYFGEGSTTTNNVCWIFPDAAFWCMQEHPSRALCQLFASPLYLREAAGARSPGAADPRCAPAAGPGRGVQLCLCSFVRQPCPPSASTIAHCHTGVLEVIQGETVLHRCRREAGAMRRSSSCSSCSMQGLCSQCQCCLPAWWALLAHRSKNQSWWEGRVFALFRQARHHYPLCSQKAMWPPILGQCTSPGLAERALLCSAWPQSFAH